MTATTSVLLLMLEKVARALGPDLCQKMTFVGGCTTGLLLTDEYTKEQVRYTDDVDLIVHAMGYLGFHSLQKELQDHGFSIGIPESGETQPICAMRLGNLRVDFMPEDEDVLGFTNKWYKAAMQTATPYSLTREVTIRLITPVYFLATKLEAFKGRGNDDVLGSRDIEDILQLLDGRAELVGEVQSAESGVLNFIAIELSALLQDRNFEYAVASQTKGNVGRENLIFERLETLTAAVRGVIG